MDLPPHQPILSEKNESQRINYYTSSSTIGIQEKNISSLATLKLFFLLRKGLREVFLPQGYPQSVSSDYLEYQIWDTIQAFCSTISGTLTTHAIFKGVGVGDSTATALSATITWIMKDGSGMVGRIGFAWWKGYSLDTDCKKWRLAADIINDVAMCTELLLGTVYFREYSPIILCFSNGMKAIVGVAGGATRASITQHQAIRNNMGDVSAKDGSQETCVNLVASFIAVFILTLIEQNTFLIWNVFLLVTSLHIFSNYKAVKSLKMKTLNTSRFLLLIQYYLRYGEILQPTKINLEESVFLGFGITDYSLSGRKINLGCSLKEAAKCNLDSTYLRKLKTIYVELPYLIAYDDRNIYVMLQDNIAYRDIIMAYYHALVLGIDLKNMISSGNDVSIEISTKTKVLQKWKYLCENLILKGWNINQHQLLVGEWRMKWTFL